MRKELLLVSGFFVAAVTLTACSSSSPAASPTAPAFVTPADEGEVAGDGAQTLLVNLEVPPAVEDGDAALESDASNFCPRTSANEVYSGSRAKRIKVTVVDATDQPLAAGYSNPTANEEVEKQFEGSDLGNWDSIFTNGCTVTIPVEDVPPGQDFYTLIVDRTEAEPSATPSRITYSLEELEGAGWEVTLTRD